MYIEHLIRERHPAPTLNRALHLLILTTATSTEPILAETGEIERRGLECDTTITCVSRLRRMTSSDASEKLQPD